jgi:hypothetical protein
MKCFFDISVAPVEDGERGLDSLSLAELELMGAPCPVARFL